MSTIILHYAPMTPRTHLRLDNILPVALAAAHIQLCWQATALLAEPSYRWGGPAWTPIVWLPGTVLTAFVGPVVGILMMILLSALIGWASGQILAHALHTGRLPLGAILPLTILWFGWIPVPPPFALTSQFWNFCTTPPGA